MFLKERQQLIQDTLLLLEEETSIYASAEDLVFFRTLAKQKKEPLPQPPSPPVLKEPKPLPAAPPSPSPTPLEPSTAVAHNPAPKAPEAPPVSQENNISWRTEVPIPHELLNFQGLKNFFQKAFPNIAILDQIPSDEMAKKLANRWKTKNKIAPISILFLTEPPSQKALLKEIAKAIDVYFGPAKLVDAASIEKEKQWETFLSSQDLKHVIVCDYTLWQLPDLMKYYKETPQQQKRMLKDTPLFLLPDLSLYSKDPMLKRSLWKSLCLKLSS